MNNFSETINATSPSPDMPTPTDPSFSVVEKVLPIIIFMIIGLMSPVATIGNMVSLVVLWKKVKESKAFLYQVTIISNDIFLILLGYVYTVQAILGVRSTSVKSLPYRQNGVLMYFFTHVHDTIFTAGCTAGLFNISFAILDRFMALTRPVVYRSFDHGKRALMCFGISYVCGFLSSLYVIPNKFLVYNSTEGAYRQELDGQYISSSRVALVGVVVETLVRASALIFMSKLSVSTIKAYRTAQQERRQNLGNANNRLVGEGTLTVLAIGQIALILAGYVPWMIFKLAKVMGVLAPDNDLMRKTMVLCLTLTLYSNFLVYVLISRDFRKASLGLLTCGRCGSEVSPVPAASDILMGAFQEPNSPPLPPLTNESCL